MSRRWAACRRLGHVRAVQASAPARRVVDGGRAAEQRLSAGLHEVAYTGLSDVSPRSRAASRGRSPMPTRAPWSCRVWPTSASMRCQCAGPALTVGVCPRGASTTSEPGTPNQADTAPCSARRRCGGVPGRWRGSAAAEERRSADRVRAAHLDGQARPDPWHAVLDERWAELLPDEERAAAEWRLKQGGPDDARRAESGDGAPEAVNSRTSIRRRRFETFDDQAPCLFALDATRENLAAAWTDRARYERRRGAVPFVLVRRAAVGRVGLEPTTEGS